MASTKLVRGYQPTTSTGSVGKAASRPLSSDLFAAQLDRAFAEMNLAEERGGKKRVELTADSAARIFSLPLVQEDPVRFVEFVREGAREGTITFQFDDRDAAAEAFARQAARASGLPTMESAVLALMQVTFPLKDNAFRSANLQNGASLYAVMDAFMEQVEQEQAAKEKAPDAAATDSFD